MGGGYAEEIFSACHPSLWNFEGLFVPGPARVYVDSSIEKVSVAAWHFDVKDFPALQTDIIIIMIYC